MTPILPTPRPGISSISHLPSGRSLLGASMNVDALLNRTRFELSIGRARHAAMQRDWNEGGEAAFTFEVLDTLTPGDATPATLRDDLKELLTLWEEKLNRPPERRY